MNVIRPLIYVPEKDTKRFVKRYGTPIMPKVCPMDGNSTREYIKQLIVTLSLKNKYVKANIMGAIKRKNLNGWKDTSF